MYIYIYRERERERERLDLMHSVEENLQEGLYTLQVLFITDQLKYKKILSNKFSSIVIICKCNMSPKEVSYFFTGSSHLGSDLILTIPNIKGTNYSTISAYRNKTVT